MQQLWSGRSSVRIVIAFFSFWFVLSNCLYPLVGKIGAKLLFMPLKDSEKRKCSWEQPEHTVLGIAAVLRERLGAAPASEQSWLWFTSVAGSLMFKISATNSSSLGDTELFKSGQRSQALLHVLAPLCNGVPCGGCSKDHHQDEEQALVTLVTSRAWALRGLCCNHLPF